MTFSVASVISALTPFFAGKMARKLQDCRCGLSGLCSCLEYIESRHLPTYTLLYSWHPSNWTRSTYYVPISKLIRDVANAAVYETSNQLFLVIFLLNSICFASLKSQVSQQLLQLVSYPCGNGKPHERRKAESAVTASSPLSSTRTLHASTTSNPRHHSRSDCASPKWDLIFETTLSENSWNQPWEKLYIFKPANVATKLELR